MSKTIHLYKFYRRKYGRELRCDAMTFDEIKTGSLEHPLYRETFYCMILIESGEIDILLDNREFHLTVGDMICGVPGMIWEWPSEIKIRGRVVIFEPEFLLAIMKDSLILDRFRYLSSNRECPILHLSDEAGSNAGNLMREMADVIKAGESFQLLLQSMLLHLLSYIENECAKNGVGSSGTMTVGRYADGFVKLVGADLYRHHDVEYYAERLCITTNYLNKISHQSLGMSSRRYIQSRIMSEAKNMLTITTMTSAEIAAALGFESPSYFSRLFKKIVRLTPLEFRNRQTGKDC